MKNLILKLALGDKIEEKDLEEELAEICEEVHSGCDSGCPIFAMNGHEVPWETKGGLENCSCFKDGKKMLAFIRKHGK